MLDPLSAPNALVVDVNCHHHHHYHRYYEENRRKILTPQGAVMTRTYLVDIEILDGVVKHSVQQVQELDDLNTDTKYLFSHRVQQVQELGDLDKNLKDVL